MRLTHALSTLALAPLAIGLLAVTGAPTASAETAQPAPDAIRVSKAGDVQGAHLPSGPLAQVATGYWSTYALTLDGRVLAEGTPYGGALDVPSSLADEDVVQIDAGYRHGLALDADGDVTTWGWMDDAKSVPATVPESVQDADVTQVAAGLNHDLALTSTGEVLAWGDSSEIGLTTVPPEVADLDVASVHAGYLNSGVLTTDGKVVAWGYAGPAPASLDDETVVALSLGEFTDVALTAEGDLVIWGTDYYDLKDVPQAVQDGDVVAVDITSGAIAAATSDGVLHTWGNHPDLGTSTVTTIPPTTGAPIADVQLESYRATIVYATLADTAPPTISGDAVVDGALSATSGSWLTTPDTYRYQWTRDGEPVGTDAATYVPTAADAGHDVAVTVTATADGVSGTSTSAPVTIAHGQFTTAPRVSLVGVARVGHTLRMTVTAASPTPDKYLRVWYRDSERLEAAGGGSTYRLTKADLGHTISAGVVAVRDGYQPRDVYTRDVRVAVGAATFRVGTLAKVKRGGSLRVNAAGLAARETYTITLDGKTLLRSRANSAGRVSKVVRVPWAARTGKRTLVVVGSYADRTGRRTATVTR
ncbi:RCC1 domain-containing protein [Nocardioides plantarum]|uniref:RCC1 domain-containing protein n=1 Tax=Nocardioides plantarum TaxID=29299 RepID=A0ABV5K446_9ACTN|nr:hypothetical protein [Nocardioides plantarum]